MLQILEFSKKADQFYCILLFVIQKQIRISTLKLYQWKLQAASQIIKKYQYFPEEIKRTTDKTEVKKKRFSLAAMLLQDRV